MDILMMLDACLSQILHQLKRYKTCNIGYPWFLLYFLSINVYSAIMGSL